MAAAPSLRRMDRRARIERVSAILRREAVDAFLVTKPANVRYLSGFTGTGSLLIRRDGSVTVASDRRYAGRVEAELAEADIDADIDFAGARSALRQVEQRIGRGVVAIEAAHLTVLEADRLRQSAPKLEQRSTEDWIEQLRLTKDEGEVDRIETAARLIGSVLDQAPELIRPGMTEREGVVALERAVAERTDAPLAFPILLASGPNTSSPHWSASTRVIEPRDLVLIDAGVQIDGYLSDMAVTFCLGTPTPGEQRILDAARQANQVALDALCAGATYADVDGAARQAIADAGYAEPASHPTGHNVGLEIHEHPFLSVARPETIEARRVVTVEPGVYEPGVRGARFEQMYLVEDGGHRLIGAR